MARIIYSGLVTAIRGSVGGTVFQSNAYGNTIKNKPVMIRPNTPNQNRSQQILSTAVKNWAIPDFGIQLNWNTFAATFPQYAKHNPSSQLSGFAAFTKWHAAFLLGQGLDAGFIANPNTIAPLMDSASLVLANVSSVLTLRMTWAQSSGDWYCNVFMSRPVTPSQNFVGTSPLFIGCVDSTNQDFNITIPWAMLYNRLPEVGSDVNVLLQLFDKLGGRVLGDVSYRLSVVDV